MEELNAEILNLVFGFTTELAVKNILIRHLLSVYKFLCLFRNTNGKIAIKFVFNVNAYVDFLNSSGNAKWDFVLGVEVSPAMWANRVGKFSDVVTWLTRNSNEVFVCMALIEVGLISGSRITLNKEVMTNSRYADVLRYFEDKHPFGIVRSPLDVEMERNRDPDMVSRITGFRSKMDEVQVVLGNGFVTTVYAEDQFVSRLCQVTKSGGVLTCIH